MMCFDDVLLGISICVCICVYMTICLSVCLSACLGVCLSFCLSVCPHACVHTKRQTLGVHSSITKACEHRIGHLSLYSSAVTSYSFPSARRKPTLGRGKMSRRRSSSVWSCRNSCVAVLWHSVLHLHLGHDKHICINRLPHTLAAFQLQGCKPEA